MNQMKTKRILLITPESTFMDSDRVFPHLGILYLVAIAENLDFHTEFIRNNKPEGAGVFYTDEFDYTDIKYYASFDIVGISCTTPQAPLAYYIKDLIKKADPTIKIIIGGPHARYYAPECVSQNFDLVCTDDGERIFAEILLEVYDWNIKIISDDLTTEEMNNYPVPKRDKEYINRYTYLMRGMPATTIVNSRGCPMQCTFCESSSTKCRWFTVGHFQKEINDILRIGIKGVMIFDDIFATNPRILDPYLRILRWHHENEGLIFRCFGHAHIIAKYKDLPKRLAQAGCVEMGFGAESANQNILNTIRKKTKVSEMHNLVEQTIQNGINVKAFFMIGLPGETNESVNDTYNFIKLYKKKYPNNFGFDLTVFFPYKGTRIGNIMRSVSYKQVDLRLLKGHTWNEIDSGFYGAYKQKQGESDIIVESYDWKNNITLLPAIDLNNWKKKIMTLNDRYKNEIVYEGCK